MKRAYLRRRWSTTISKAERKVHEEQVAWLKKRDVAKSVEEKSKLIEPERCEIWVG